VQPSERWRHDLDSWRIPDAILQSVAESPWGFPRGLFELSAEQALASEPSPSHQRSLEALGPGGTVLDVGCGGGAASLPLRERASRVTGVDSSETMLAGFRALAAEAGASVETVLGEWPESGASVAPADVVVSHHVVYNVPVLVPFIQALHEHARRRVVIELTRQHPLMGLNPLWLRFHGIERPTRPTADDAVEVVREAGFEPQRQDWEGKPFEGAFSARDPAAYADWIRRRLCLPPGRLADVVAAIAEAGGPGGVGSARHLTTLWWDV